MALAFMDCLHARGLIPLRQSGQKGRAYMHEIRYAYVTMHMLMHCKFA